MNASCSRLVMLGAAPETRGSIAAVVAACREAGLFARWPIDYLATRGAGGPVRQALLAAKAAHRFAMLLARHRRLAVHAHLAGHGGLWREAPILAAAIAARRPLLVQLHGAGFERSAPPELLRFVLERAACVAVPSESMRVWVRNVARNAHAVCLPPPVARAVEPPALGPRPNLVLFLGRLEAAKGIYDLLEAVAAVRAAVPDVRLVCAGEGERIAVARCAERLGIADAVKFTGWVGPSGKRALFEAAAAFALPSYDEALPASLLEAMASAVPVFATAVGGIPEVVVDGVNGGLFAPGDKSTLARLLQRVLVDRALGARLGAAGRESVLLRYAPERALPRLEELYAALGLHAVATPPVRLRSAAMKEAA